MMRLGRMYQSLKHLLGIHNYEIWCGTLSHVPLRGGNHTSFNVIRCEYCPKMRGFPSENLELALREGTEETVSALKEYF